MTFAMHLRLRLPGSLRDSVPASEPTILRRSLSRAANRQIPDLHSATIPGQIAKGAERNPLVPDGRHFFDRSRLTRAGLLYFGLMDRCRVKTHCAARMIAHHNHPLKTAASSSDRSGIWESLTGRVSVEVFVRDVSTSSRIGSSDHYLSGRMGRIRIDHTETCEKCSALTGHLEQFEDRGATIESPATGGNEGVSGGAVVISKRTPHGAFASSRCESSAPQHRFRHSKRRMNACGQASAGRTFGRCRDGCPTPDVGGTKGQVPKRVPGADNGK